MKTLSSQWIQAKAPAKLILSGEHAVVYGAPALGMTLNSCFTTTTLSLNPGKQILVKLENFQREYIFDQQGLRLLKQKTDERYVAFLNKQLLFSEVLASEALVPYIMACYAEEYNVSYEGLEIAVSSTIPLQSGLGSSAACIISVLRALSKGFEPINPDVFVSLAQQIEHLVHGKSSGFDVQLVFQEGCLYYDQNQYHAYPLPFFPFQLVNTGTPEASTADCIQVAAPFFSASQTLLSDFRAVAQGLLNGIKQQNLPEILDNIAINHRLLCDIGVVPDKVKDCIAKIEKRGNAAKICGAGSCRGEQAGVILIVGENLVSDVLAQYDYFVLNRGEFHG